MGNLKTWYDYQLNDTETVESSLYSATIKGSTNICFTLYNLYVEDMIILLPIGELFERCCTKLLISFTANRRYTNYNTAQMSIMIQVSSKLLEDNVSSTS